MIEEFIDRWLRGGSRETGDQPRRDIRLAAGVYPYAAPIDYILELMLTPETAVAEERETPASP